MSRVINDIITIAVTYLIICIGFSFGMIILLDEKVMKLTPKAAIKGKFSIPKTGNHQVLLWGGYNKAGTLHIAIK